MSAAAEWCGFGAELLVAGVIYLEFEYNRRVKFVEEATSKEAADDRFTIYKEFCELPDSTLRAKSKSFAERLRSDECQGLRGRCERQLALLNNLGFESTRPLSINRDLKKLFPHGPVRMGIILHDCMRDELRRCGPWNARHAMEFMLACLKIVKKSGQQITVAYAANEIAVDEEDLLRLEKSLIAWTGSGQPSLTRSPLLVPRPSPASRDFVGAHPQPYWFSTTTL
jgi:hypothetical protein